MSTLLRLIQALIQSHIANPMPHPVCLYVTVMCHTKVVVPPCGTLQLSADPESLHTSIYTRVPPTMVSVSLCLSLTCVSLSTLPFCPPSCLSLPPGVLPTKVSLPHFLTPPVCYSPGSEDSQGSAGQGQGVGMVALALVEGDRPGRRGCPPSSLSARAGYLRRGAVCAPAMQGPLGGPGTGIV